MLPADPTTRPSQTPRVLRQTAVIGLVVLFAHFMGWFSGLDQTFAGAVLDRARSPSRDDAPLLLAIDAPTLDAWGPLPWSASRWGEVSQGLAAAGVHEVWLVDALSQVLADGPTEPTLTSARIQVPRLLIQVPGGRGLPLEAPRDRLTPPFVSWDHQLYLPARDDGVIRDIAEGALAGDLFGPSAFCEWVGRCPSGGPLSQPLRLLHPAGSLPAISLVDVVEGDRVPDQARLTLLGVTAPWSARLVHAGQHATLMTWPEAVSQAVASVRAAPPIPDLGRMGDALILLLVLTVSALAGRLDRYVRIGLFMGVLPVGVVLLAGIAVAAGWLLPPVTGAFLAALAPLLVTSLASRRVAMDFLRRVALLIVQDGFRYAWRSTRIRTREDLLFKLGALTRNHTASSRCAYLHVQPRTTRLRWVGGFGVDESDLDGATFDLGRAPFRDARRRPEGAPADDALIDAGQHGRLIPIRQGRTLVGFWLVVYDTQEIDPVALSNLARWLSRHLDIEGTRRAPALREWLLDRLESETAAVQELFAAASEERRRQIQTLHAVEAPLLTADIAGSVIFVNRALGRLFDETELGPVRSVRELLYRLQGEGGLQALMDQVFVSGRTISLRWGGAGRRYDVRVQPVFEIDHGGHQARTLGYVAWFHDRTEADSLDQVRDTVLRFASYKIRNSLMVVLGYAGLLRARATDDETRGMLGVIAAHAQGVSDAVESLSQAGDTEAEARVDQDPVELVQRAIDDVQPLAQQRHLRVRASLPEVALPVSVIPNPTAGAIGLLLRQACALATVGGDVQVLLWEMREASRLRVTWTGGGLDSELLELCQGDWEHDIAALPADLHVYAQARQALPGLELSSSPTGGITVTCFLPRAGAPA